MRNLSDTVGLMLSDDSRDRFIAEFRQLRIRRYKLWKHIIHYSDENNPLKLKGALQLMIDQYKNMTRYQLDLIRRAFDENIDLKDI